MKNIRIKQLFGIVLFAVAIFTISCEIEDNYDIRTGEIISEITTGSANVTAVSAELSGTVKNLSLVSSSSYEVGVFYGTSDNPTTEGAKKSGVADENGNISTTITGLTSGTTYYYAIYVKLQNKVTKFGEIKSFVATDVKVVTKEATDITSSKAVFSAEISGTEGVESYESGVKLSLDANNISEGVIRNLSTVHGLLPNTTYFYTAFVKIGNSFIYGETKNITTDSKELEYVDLGLSVLWAKSNIGADTESEPGALFGYGDKTAMLTSTKLEDYPSFDIAGGVDDIVYDLSIDINSTMKSQMPTSSQITELINNTTQEWVTVDGVKGVRFTANNGNSIFMPAGGYRDGDTQVSDDAGYYWSGNIYNIHTDYANTLTFNNSKTKNGFSKRSLGLSVRSVRAYADINSDSDKIIFGDLENNGRLRIEIFNEFGSTSNNPPIDPSTIKFDNNMVVTFTLSGITNNLKNDASGSYVAGLEFTDPSWGVSYWSSLEMGQYEAMVTGDGTYTVWMEVENKANGALVFCIDIADLGKDIEDWSKVMVDVNSIKLDADTEQIINHSIVNFNNKDGNNIDGRIEIYNEYGSSGAIAQGVYNNSMKFNGMMIVEFTIDGIDNNLIEGASSNYFTELSYAAASWDPSYWGGANYGSANITGDGKYQVYTYLNGNCEGAVVWTIELYDLWKDLIDESKINVIINKVITPSKY